MVEDDAAGAPKRSPSFLNITFNTAFVSSPDGLLTLVEMCIGIVVFSLAINCGMVYLLLVPFAFWTMCALFLISGTLSHTGSLLPATLFFFLYHVAGSLLYLAGGIAVLAWGSTYDHAIDVATGVLGVVAAVCHMVHVAFIYNSP